MKSTNTKKKSSNFDPWQAGFNNKECDNCGQWYHQQRRLCPRCRSFNTDKPTRMGITIGGKLNPSGEKEGLNDY